MTACHQLQDNRKQPVFLDICCSIAECSIIRMPYDSLQQTFHSFPSVLVLMPVACHDNATSHVHVHRSHQPAASAQVAVQSAVKVCTSVLEVLFFPHEPQTHRGWIPSREGVAGLSHWHMTQGDVAGPPQNFP